MQALKARLAAVSWKPPAHTKHRQSLFIYFFSTQPSGTSVTLHSELPLALYPGQLLCSDPRARNWQTINQSADQGKRITKVRFCFGCNFYLFFFYIHMGRGALAAQTYLCSSLLIKANMFYSDAYSHLGWEEKITVENNEWINIL